MESGSSVNDSKLEEIGKVLRIDPTLLLKWDKKSFAAIVTKQWLETLKEDSDTVYFQQQPDGYDICQINALLHHSCTSIDVEFCKLSITPCCLRQLKRTFLFQVPSCNRLTNFQNRFTKSFNLSWKKALLKYKNAYHIAASKKEADHCLTASTAEVDINHVNVIPLIATCVENETCYIIQPYTTHSVLDALLYSPKMLHQSESQRLFLVYQLLKVMSFVSCKFPTLELTSLSWKNVKLDSRFWLQIDLFSSEGYFSSLDLTETSQGETDSNETVSEDNLEISHVVDLWVSGKMNNFDYLMFLNKLAGRRLDDPFHHPILPWVSNLAEPDSNWRDLSKSKYRLNKGDKQLDLQYEMAAKEKHSSISGHPHVPHHVPDMLSDITFYVYLARRIPKDILQKHVRSYWEPNEYPATVQRIQAWSPDECIPQFFTDPSVFTSIHSDMEDLGVPDWCSGPEDFVTKHMEMLESETVSLRLHKWIDVTFGYLLSGRPAINELNVCRQLVDNHTTPSSHGIVQLFSVPHPQKRVASHTLLPDLVDSHLRDMSDTFEENINKKTSYTQIIEGDDSSKGNSSKLGKPKTKIKLPEGYDPLYELNQLETLLNFKSAILNKANLTQALQNTLDEDRQSITQTTLEEVVSDHNVLVLFCLVMELYSSQNLHANFSDQPLSRRFEAAALCFDSSKHSLPVAIQKMLYHILSLTKGSLSEKCQQLKDLERAVAEGNVDKSFLIRIFKPVTQHSIPAPSVDQFLCQELFLFPTLPYFEDLYHFIELLMTLTKGYTASLGEEYYSHVGLKLSGLLDKLHGQNEGLSILVPHLLQILSEDVFHAVPFLAMVFDMVAQELGVKETTSWFLKPVVELGNKVNSLCHKSFAGNQTDVCNAVEILYGKPFLVQLWNRWGFETFLETVPRLLTECLIRLRKKMEIIMDSLQWMMMRLGPTLTSKYIIRHLLRVANICFQGTSDVVRENHVQVIDCLVFAASMYGSSFFTGQYIPHISYTVSSAISGTRFTARSFAALEASCTILVHLIPYFDNTVMMHQLRRLSKEIVMPLIGILSSKRIKFPGGGLQRKRLCSKTIKLIVTASIQIGREMSQQHMNELLRSLFCNFTLLRECHQESEYQQNGDSSNATQFEMDEFDTPHYLIPSEDSISVALQMEDRPRSKPTEASLKSEQETARENELARQEKQKFNQEVLLEIREAFCPETASKVYIPLARLMGGQHMEKLLRQDHDYIWKLSTTFEKHVNGSGSPSSGPSVSKSPSSKVKVVSNQIVIDHLATANPKIPEDDRRARDLNGNGYTHLKGNWLAYWEHEIGLADDDSHIHFNQIELQKFVGHSAAVKSVFASNCEGWFMTSGKDKTVRIWSLNGSSSEQVEPLFTYRQHRKTVFHCSLVSADNTVVSCDGSLHVWDPYSGQQIKCFDSSEFKPNSIASVLTLPSPQRQVLLNTSDAIKMVDLRTQAVVCEYKTAVGQSSGVLRTMCSNGSWVAAGRTGGAISLFDLRMGPILRIWLAHDNDVITTNTLSDKTFVTTSMDQTIAIWDISLAKVQMVYRSVPDPVQSTSVFHSELVTASFSNKITVLRLPSPDGTRIAEDKPITATKLRSDCLKGSLTAFTVLPNKRQLIVTSDTGGVKLLA